VNSTPARARVVVVVVVVSVCVCGGGGVLAGLQQAEVWLMSSRHAPTPQVTTLLAATRGRAACCPAQQPQLHLLGSGSAIQAI